jgi:hypothetical protein
MAVPGAIYGLFMNFTGLGMIAYGRQLSTAKGLSNKKITNRYVSRGAGSREQGGTERSRRGE